MPEPRDQQYQQYQQYGGPQPSETTLPGPVPVNVPRVLSPEERRAVLAQAVQRHVLSGGRVQSQTDQNAVILWGSKPNHVLHLILTLVTMGLWVFIWIIVALAVKETRTLVAVDDFGNVLEQRA